MICDLMTSLSIDMRTFMVREIKMEWDSLFCFLFYEDFIVLILVLKIILMYYFHIFVLLKKKSDLCKT